MKNLIVFTYSYLPRRSFRVLLAFSLLGAMSACGTKQNAENNKFFTSGSNKADQRAEQRMASSQQLRGEANAGKSTPEQLSLYQRLGGDQGLHAIVADFLPRAMADPRVNWDRKGVTYGGFAGIGTKSAAWKATPENVKALTEHMVQFLSLATGGPTKYQGKEIGSVHAGMKITNTEFDAAIGDMKASLDKLGVATPEQKELLAILESTRPQVVTVR